MAERSRVFPRFQDMCVMVTGAGTGFGRTLAHVAHGDADVADDFF